MIEAIFIIMLITFIWYEVKILKVIEKELESNNEKE